MIAIGKVCAPLKTAVPSLREIPTANLVFTRHGIKGVTNFFIGNYGDHQDEIDSLIDNPHVNSALFQFSPDDQFANYIPLDKVTIK